VGTGFPKKIMRNQKLERADPARSSVAALPIQNRMGGPFATANMRKSPLGGLFF